MTLTSLGSDEPGLLKMQALRASMAARIKKTGMIFLSDIENLRFVLNLGQSVRDELYPGLYHGAQNSHLSSPCLCFIRLCLGLEPYS